MKDSLTDREETYDEAVSYILEIPKFAVKIGTDNLKVLMKKLGNPHLKLKAVHVAGTNGKGSVTEFIRSILTSAGYKTASFTSPHLVKINERIRIDGIYISDGDFTEYYKRIKEKSMEMEEEGYGHPSFFEFVFAMAALYFYDKKVDYAVFETGMGGRLDATNVLNPLVSVITSIGLDHTKYLGDTIEKIAFEKAGIIKRHVPVVYNTKTKDADKVIEKTAEDLSSPLYNVEKTKVIINEISVKTIDFSIDCSYYKYHNLKIKKTALYQIDNAASAVTAVKVILPDIPDEFIYRGLFDFYWAGRMENLSKNIILDGAHNEEAIEEFVHTVKNFYAVEKKKLFFAVANDKDYRNMIKYLVTNIHFDIIYLTEINSQRGTDSCGLEEVFKEYLKGSDDAVIISGNVSSDMFDLAYENLKDDEILFCVGSLYLIGEIKEYFGRKYND